MVYDKPLFLTKVDIKISFEGKLLKFSKPIYRNVNRYYLPLFELIKHLGGKVNFRGRKIYLLFKKKYPICIDSEIDNYKITVINKKFYFSLFDICRVLNIKSKWDYNNRCISLYWNRYKLEMNNANQLGRAALIRLEDITAGDEYMESEKLEKFRVVADYMFSSRIPFHIAWIPRFIDPRNGIDNDISRDYSMQNAHFLFTIEYLLNRNGIIGLHGYTHQYGEEVSGEGTEFNEERNTDEESIRKRIEAAIDIARRLELPAKFFESPHYASTAFQQSIYEQYFDIIYEGCIGIWGEKIVKSPRNNRTLYVPTPLGYVEGEDGTEKILNRINNISKDTLASLFYHPYIEFDFINLISGDRGYPMSSYSENSPLHRITKALFDKSCRFLKVSELRCGDD
jgi:hypothetical protein